MTEFRLPPLPSLNQAELADATADLREANLDFAKSTSRRCRRDASPFTLSTAARSSSPPMPRPSSARSRFARWRSTLPTPHALGRALDMSDHPCARCRSTRACARSSRASRSRISGSTSRTDTAIAPMQEEDHHAVVVGEELTHGMKRGHAVAVHRHSRQDALRGASRAQHAHARRRADHARPEGGSASRRLRRHDSQGDDHRAGRLHRGSAAAARADARSRRRLAASSK